MIELCPLCGKPPIVEETNGGKWGVACDFRHIELSAWDFTREDAIVIWNEQIKILLQEFTITKREHFPDA